MFFIWYLYLLHRNSLTQFCSIYQFDRPIKIILSCTCFIPQNMSHLFVAGPGSLTKNKFVKNQFSLQKAVHFSCDIQIPKPECKFSVLRNDPLLHPIQVSRFAELTQLNLSYFFFMVHLFYCVFSCIVCFLLLNLLSLILHFHLHFLCCHFKFFLLFCLQFKRDI